MGVASYNGRTHAGRHFPRCRRRGPRAASLSPIHVQHRTYRSWAARPFVDACSRSSCCRAFAKSLSGGGWRQRGPKWRGTTPRYDSWVVGSILEDSPLRHALCGRADWIHRRESRREPDLATHPPTHPPMRRFNENPGVALLSSECARNFSDCSGRFKEAIDGWGLASRAKLAPALAAAARGLRQQLPPAPQTWTGWRPSGPRIEGLRRSSLVEAVAAVVATARGRWGPTAQAGRRPPAGPEPHLLMHRPVD